MNKLKLNVIVDVLAFLTFLGSAISGLSMWSGITFGLQSHFWKELHSVASLWFVAFVVIHVILHLSFIKNIPKCFKKP